MSFIFLGGTLKKEVRESIKAPFKSRLEINDYLIDQAAKLDSIEGFWSLAVKRTLFKDGSKIKSETELHRMGLAIIKEGDFYRVYDGKTNSNFIGSFAKTSDPTLFKYQCYFIETKDFVSAVVSFKDQNKLHYEYDTPSGLMKQYYMIGTDNQKKAISDQIEDGSLRLQWKFVWEKQYPYKEDKRDWANYGKHFPEIAKDLIF